MSLRIYMENTVKYVLPHVFRRSVCTCAQPFVTPHYHYNPLPQVRHAPSILLEKPPPKSDRHWLSSTKHDNGYGQQRREKNISVQYSLIFPPCTGTAMSHQNPHH